MPKQSSLQARWPTMTAAEEGCWYWGIAQRLLVVGSIGYWVIFLLAVIPNTDTAQTSWCQWCGSCQQMMAGRLGSR